MEKVEAAIQRCSYKNVFWKYAANFQENTHVEVWNLFQLYGNDTSAWVFPFKFAAYFHNTFSQEHFWMAASEKAKL